MFPSCLLRPQPTFILTLRRPDVLDKTVALRQAVQSVVGLAHSANEAAEGVDVVLAGDGAAGLVNLGDGDLNGGVVLGLDDAVGGRALAGDVAISQQRRGWVSTVYSLFGLFRFCRKAVPRCSRGSKCRASLTGPRSRHGRSPF